jgi:fructosamine-3-kinase
VIDASCAQRVRRALGKLPIRSQRLTGGCVADVYRLEFSDGGDVVAKIATAGGLAVEAWMLRRLASESSLPVPEVLYADDDLLLLEHVDNDGGPISSSVQRHAAELLASLHEITADEYGLERDTVIGSLAQPNAANESWVAFFRESRLLAMGRRAMDCGALSSAAMSRLERLALRLDEWIPEPAQPALIHGDVWGGNVLVRSGKVAAFVDPAIYFADPEIELAFTTLFSTFGKAFFDRYASLRAIAPEFFEYRRDLYNLYPLLVHAVLFGGDYGSSVDRTVTRFVG